jgi:hypothetical protein
MIFELGVFVVSTTDCVVALWCVRRFVPPFCGRLDSLFDVNFIVGRASVNQYQGFMALPLPGWG